jgi:hypothetical protein
VIESTNALNADEYELCQRRGHQSSGLFTTEGFGTTWAYCRWCGVRSRTVESVEEHDDDLERLEAGDLACAGREVAGATPVGTGASRPAIELPETLDETLAVLDELWTNDAGFVQCGWRLVTARGHVVLRPDADRPSAWNGGGHPIYVKRVESDGGA